MNCGILCIILPVVLELAVLQIFSSSGNQFVMSASEEMRGVSVGHLNCPDLCENG